MRKRGNKYKVSRADVCVVAIMVCVLAFMSFVFVNPLESALSSALGALFSSTELAAWSGVDWIRSSNTKTQAAVRTGIVWTFTGWIIKPALRFVFTRRWRGEDEANR
jgi:hypothetical protein